MCNLHIKPISSYFYEDVGVIFLAFGIEPYGNSEMGIIAFYAAFMGWAIQPGHQSRLGSAVIVDNVFAHLFYSQNFDNVLGSSTEKIMVHDIVG